VQKLFPRLQPAAATPITPREILASIPGRRNAIRDFDYAIAGMIKASSAIALSSLMRSTFVAVTAAKHRLPKDAVVMLPRYCCPSFLHGIRASGMRYDYCDLDGETLRVELPHLQAKSHDRIGALLIPNLFGLASDMNMLSDYCRRQGWILIEGADYTFGGSMFGKPFGTFGDITILNFQEGKALPIGGGMVLSKTDNDFRSEETVTPVSNLFAFLRSLVYSVLIRPRAYGLFNKALAIAKISKKRFSMEDTIRDTRSESDFSIPNKNMLQGISSFQAKLGLRLLTKLDQHVRLRSSVARRLEAGLQDVSEINLIPRHAAIDRCHYIRYPILVPSGNRDRLVEFVCAHGFEASPMYVEHGMRIGSDQFPGASQVCNEIVTLPCHPFMTDRDVQNLIKLIRNFFSAN
jgi:dTDP-4-amino-4,6-dideoxygalactose transaminase